MAAGLEKLVERLEKVATRLEAVTTKGSASSGTDQVDTAQVEAYEKFVKDFVDPFVALSTKIGDVVAEQANLFKGAFQKQKDYLMLVAKFNVPDPNDLPKLLKPTSDCMSGITEFREKKRAHKFFNHLSSVSESVAALGWVTVSPKPKIFCKEMADAGQFYINRVIKEYKDKEAVHVEWARSLQKIFSELHEYINTYHQTGVSWNPSGPKATGASAASGGGGGGAPPPPPPGPPPPPEDTGAAAPKPDVNRNALFAAINKGSDITSGLKKVSKDQMTHKNPALRNTGPVPYKAPTANKPISAPRPFGTTSAPKKPPKFELDGKKWLVEYQDGNKNLVISNTNLNQTVYVYRCDNCVVQVKGKVNSITLDGCKKSAVVFEDLVSMCEFINCQSVQAQANGKVPTISIDKTDGCQLYLNKDCLDVDIITAKSSEMNVLIPKGDGDFSEYAVAEQFKTKWTGSGLKTEPSDIVG